MALRISLLSVVLVVATVLVTSHANSQEGGAEHPTPEQMKEMMEQWIKLGKPGEMHEYLARFVGKWDTVMKMSMGPGAPTQETKGTADFRTIFGGRFLLHESKGTLMGMPTEGMGITGYDNFRNRFEGVWIDGMATTMLTFSGQLDPSGKVLTLYGEMDEPGLKMVGRMVKYVTRVIDGDKFVFEIYDLAAGPDHKVFDITYTRRKE